MAETGSHRILGKACCWVIFGFLALLPLATYVSTAMAVLPSSRVDFDGDGKTDFAVWRLGTGYWYILRSSDGEVTAQQWGLGSASDKPVNRPVHPWGKSVI